MKELKAFAKAPEYRRWICPFRTLDNSCVNPFLFSICKTVLQVSMGINIIRKNPTTKAATTTSRPMRISFYVGEIQYTCDELTS